MRSNEELYRHWLKRRRRARPRPELADRVMAAVTRAEIHPPVTRMMLVLAWFDRSRVRRVAACVGALLVGAMPFAYVAYIARIFDH